MALRRPRWTTPALADLLRIGSYIASENQRAGARVTAAIYLHAIRLADLPELGRSGRVQGTRELVVPRLPYVIIYRLVAGEAEILSVMHTSQRYP